MTRSKEARFKRALAADLRAGLAARSIDDARLAKRDAWKRDISGRPNGTLDPWYQCDLQDEMIDYALNFSLPWSQYYLTLLFT